MKTAWNRSSIVTESLRTYFWTTNNAGSDICNKMLDYGSGSCGFNSYSTSDSVGRSNCECPPYYSFIDPTIKFKGCKPDFAAQSCKQGGETSFSFTQINNVDWPLYVAEQLSPMNEADCTDNCLKDCFCLVAIYHNKNMPCCKKKFSLSNGRMQSNLNRKAFIKYSTVNNSTFTVPHPYSIEEKIGWRTLVFVIS